MSFTPDSEPERGNHGIMIHPLRSRLLLFGFALLVTVTSTGCSYFGMAGIQRAARNGDIELAQNALLGGASANLRDRLGNTPLHFAAQRDLLGFIPTGNPGSDWKTILKAANTLSDVMVINLLLDNGADINAVNKQGRTALHTAALHNSPQMAFFLLAHGADAQVKDKIGQTPMDLAMQHGYKDLMDMLEKYGDKLLIPGGLPLNVLPDAPGTIAPAGEARAN